MALPSGFDPETGTLGRVGNTIRRIAPTPIRTYTNTNTYSYSHRSGWERFSDGVPSIGKWIQETAAEKVAMVVAGLPAIGGIISLLIWIVKVFINEGLFLGILSIWVGALAVGAGYYAFCLIFGISYLAIRLLGYIFYNAYTLLITLVVGAGITIGVIVNNSTPIKTTSNKATTTTATTQSYTVYLCTAKQLNVRAAPSTNSKVLGTISRGTSVMVYGFEGEFARIKWNGQTAYVSKNYITK